MAREVLPLGCHWGSGEKGQIRLTMYRTVSTVRYMGERTATKPNRHNCPINVLVRPDQKQRLETEFNRTNVNRSAMVRKALDLLFDQIDSGQLKLGFAEIERGVE